MRFCCGNTVYDVYLNKNHDEILTNVSIHALSSKLSIIDHAKFHFLIK